MRNKCLKIVVFLLLITGVIIGLNRSIHQKNELGNFKDGKCRGFDFS